MSPALCSRGAELFQTAAGADEVFKARLIEFFSHTRKDEQEMKDIEVLGIRHREADEAFHRHRKFCETCAGIPADVLRYAAAD